MIADGETPRMIHHLIARKVHSTVTELYLGIRTTGSSPVPDNAVLIPYIPIPYRAIFPILSTVALGPDDVFVDVGCGKGRMVCCASRWPAREVIGIDFDQALVQAAQQNSVRVRGRQAPTRLLCARAEDYSYADITVAYLYHPFERPVMERFLARFEATMRRDRSVRLVYANPVHDDLFRSADWLVEEEVWPETKISGFPHRVSFWRTRAGTTD